MSGWRSAAAVIQKTRLFEAVFNGLDLYIQFFCYMRSFGIGRVMRQIKIEDLHVGGLKIYRDTQGFCFGTDAVLLSWFAGLKKARKICDLCTGTGIVAFLLSHKLPGAEICGVDILPQSVQLAQEAARLNGLSQRVTFLQADVKEIRTVLDAGRCDLVCVNPPYWSVGSGAAARAEDQKAARMEFSCTFDDVAAAAAFLLKQGGRFCLIHRAERMVDVLASMRRFGLEPKELCMIVPKQGAAPKLFLCEGKKGGAAGLKIVPNLVLYDDDGAESAQLRQIYGKEPVESE